MLKNYRLLAAAAAIAAVPAAALAADLPPPYSPPPAAEAMPFTPASAYDWSGFYGGVHGGYAWGEFETDGLDFGSVDADGDGFFGGVQAGYNAQFGNIVAGLEADWSWSGIDGDDNDNLGDISADLNWFGTARGRVGYAWDRVLFYGTGGLAFGETEVASINGSEKNTALGWTAGGGIETAVTDNITIKGEYLYVDLGEEDFTTPLGDEGEASYDAHTFRVGLNYKF